MRIRGPLNPGPVALLLVAIVAVPEILKKCKPLAKSMGDFLVQAGNEIHRMAEVDEPAAPKASADAEVHPPTDAATNPAPPAETPAATIAESAPEQSPEPPAPTDEPAATESEPGHDSDPLS